MHHKVDNDKDVESNVQTLRCLSMRRYISMYALVELRSAHIINVKTMHL